MAEENNVGASRLLGTNSLQQAVDALTNTVNKLSAGMDKLTSAVGNNTSSNNRASGSSTSGNWNQGSNRNNYSSNGGGGKFSNAAGAFSAGYKSGNGGGGRFGNLGSGSRLSAGMMAVGAIAGAAASYGNQNLAGMMQQNYYGVQTAMASGNVSQANINTATRQLLANNYGALNMSDALQGGYINQYTFGPAMNTNGGFNANYSRGAFSVGGFAYANPTQGYAAAASAAQQVYSARSIMMGQAYNLGINPNNPNLGAVAQQIMARAYNGNKMTNQNIAAALSQNGGLNVSLQNMAGQFGWSQQTVQSMEQYMQQSVLAQSKGLSFSQFNTLMGQAGSGNKTAMNKLKSIGIGTSAFEAQRNLNATRTGRQSDINESLATAFTNTTNVVNQFSQAMTAMLKNTGLDKLIGTAAGTASPISNALSGFSNVFGMGAGLYGASKLFGGGGGGLGLLGQLFKRGGGGGGSGLGTQAADGAYNITTLGAESGGGLGIAAGGAAVGIPALGVAGLAYANNLGTNAENKSFAQQSVNNWKLPMGLQWPSNYTTADKQKLKNAAIAADMWQPRGNTKEGAGTQTLWYSNYFSKHPGNGGKGNTSMPTQAGGGSSGVVGNTPGNGSTNVGANAAEVIGFAKKELGVPYGWGMEAPGKAFDCSGLTQWAYGQAGVKIPRVAADQQKTGTAVNVNNTQPGDLLFVGNPAHHVVMNAGGGQIIEAPHTGADVRMRALNPSEFSSATRIVGSVGSLSGSQQVSPTTLNQTAGTAGGDIGAYSSTSELANLLSALATGAGGSVQMPGSSTSASTSNGSATGGTAGGNPPGNGKNDKASLQAYAKQLLAKYGWSGQWQAFNALEMSEAGWDYQATNPSSGAYGLAQALPASKYASTGSDWKTNGDTQLQWMMQYIKGRYGDPNAAWSFHQKNNWYAVGAWEIPQDQNATVHAGEMIIPAKQAETIRQAITNNMFSPTANNAGGAGAINFGDINVILPTGYSGTAVEAQTTAQMIRAELNEQLRVKNLQIGV